MFGGGMFGGGMFGGGMFGEVTASSNGAVATARSSVDGARAGAVAATRARYAASKLVKTSETALPAGAGPTLSSS
jgi:hypothetical protein